MPKSKLGNTLSNLVQSTSTLSKKARERRSSYSRQLFILGIAILAVIAMFPRGRSYQFADLREGEIYVGEQIVAPFTFSINKSTEEYEQDTQTAKKKVEPVFVRVDSIATLQIKTINTLFDSTTLILSADTNDSTKSANLTKLFGSYLITVTEETLNFFPNNIKKARASRKKIKKSAENSTSITLKEFREGTIKIAKDIYSIGILNIARKDLPNDPGRLAIDNGQDVLVEDISDFLSPETYTDACLDKLRNTFSLQSSRKPAYDILAALLKPNIIYLESETAKRIELAANRVPRAKNRVFDQERIIDKHEKITTEHLQKLSSLAEEKARRAGGTDNLGLIMPFLGRFFLIIIGFSFLIIYLILAEPQFFQDTKKFMLAITTILLVLFLANLVNTFSLSEYLIPAALGSMLLTIFFGTRVGFMGTVTLAILLGGLRGNEFSIALITFTVGTASVLSVRRVRSRSWIFQSILWVTGGYMISIGALELLRFSNFDEAGLNLFWGAINGFLCPIFAYGLMVIFEYIFDMTTDATLLELSDLHKPLLRKLALRAPGTYHHSILVGTLAEAAAERMGANSLLARVGAYYHDIGKMDKPEYFVENQKGGTNPHDKLSPSMSYLVLVSHVKRGLEIAEEYALPKEIQQIISEHHGTSVISFFYAKALEKNDTEVNDIDFRYPGPRPRTRETGIVMLADSVEAASRALKDPTVSRLKGMVNGIIDDRYRNCELDDCPLTFRDLNHIKESFVQILTGVFHGRIEYPDQEKLVDQIQNGSGDGAPETVPIKEQD